MATNVKPLAARWTRGESLEGDTVRIRVRGSGPKAGKEGERQPGAGKLGFGNISGWSRGTANFANGKRSKGPDGKSAARPRQDARFENERDSQPISSVGNCVLVRPVVKPWDGSKVTLPGKSKGVDFTDPDKIDEIRAKSAVKRLNGSDNYARVYANGVQGTLKEFENTPSKRREIASDEPQWFRELQRMNKVSQCF